MDGWKLSILDLAGITGAATALVGLSEAQGGNGIGVPIMWAGVPFLMAAGIRHASIVVPQALNSDVPLFSFANIVRLGAIVCLCSLLVALLAVGVVAHPTTVDGFTAALWSVLSLEIVVLVVGVALWLRGLRE